MKLGIGALAFAAALCVHDAKALVGASSDGGAFAPHVVMVLKSSTRGAGAGICSGVVVARDIVLTAAHCVGLAGETRVHFRGDGGEPVLLSVAAVATHPQYRANAARTRERSIDLALVRSATPLPARFHPAPLDAGRAISVGDRFRIAGFGVTRERVGPSAGVLRAGTLAARAPLSAILLWAEDPERGGFGACEGDSGGPVFTEAGDTVVALVDWAEGANGKGCGKLTQGALVAPQRGWIDAVSRGWSGR